MLNTIADNVWAFLLFVLAVATAVTASFRHDKDLFTFAGTVAMTGAALFHGKSDKNTPDPPAAPAA
jgi:hypothetical protein